MEYSFFNSTTGYFSKATYTGTEPELNTPEGYTSIVGLYDYLSKKVNVVSGLVEEYIPTKPEDTTLVTYTWFTDVLRWVPIPTLLLLQNQAYVSIDAAAGAARARYITEVPGQQAVYLRKAEQARSFAAAGYTGTVPPYIAAEASATSSTSQETADSIIAIATLWDDTLSPAIEAIRIGSKRAVSSATIETLPEILSEALSNLAAI